MFSSEPLAVASSAPSGPIPPFSLSTPLANFVPEYYQGGGPAANGDGTTGWTTNGTWTVLQQWVLFPTDDFYTFTVPASVNSITAAPGNSVMVYVDQLQIPTTIGNPTNNNWFSQFVQNVAPSQNYTFSAPVRAGWHNINVVFNSNAYEGIGGTANNTNVHGDRLIINAQQSGLPAEPAGSRNPATNPLSSYHFMNVPFGANATWLSLTSAVAETLNGGGGNGAAFVINSTSFSSNVWQGDAGDPIMIIQSADGTDGAPQLITSGINLPYGIKAPAGLYPSFGSDNLNVLCDNANPRYRYVGFGQTEAGRQTGWYRMAAVDSYNLNHAVPQSLIQAAGLITNLDLNSGVIAHRLIGGLAFNGSIPGWGPGTQTSQWSGMPWPGCESDAAWEGEYTNPNGVPYGSVVGIPPGTSMPGGMSAGGQMLFTCLQNYGLFLNVSVGTYPDCTFYVEGAAADNPLLPTSGDLATLISLMSVMSNPAPIVVGQGFGGGSPRVPLLPGVAQGYPSLGLPTVPTQNYAGGIPILAQPRGGSSASGPGSPQGSTTVPIPVGSFVVVYLQAAAANNTFTTFVDSAGNSYTVLQPTANSTNVSIALAYCLSTTHLMPVGTTFTLSGGANFWGINGGFYLPPPASGTPTLHASSSTANASDVTSLSLTAAGTVGDLAIGYTSIQSASGGSPGATTTGLINEASGFNALMASDALSLDSAVVGTTGTVTYGPSWVTSQPAAGILATFSGVNTSFVQQTPIAIGVPIGGADSNLNAPFAGTLTTIMEVPVGTFLVVTVGAGVPDLAWAAGDLVDSVGNVYSLAIQTPATAGVNGTSIWYCNTTIAMPIGTILTLSPTADSFILFAGAISGVTGSLDRTAQAASSGSVETLSASTGTLTQSNELIVGICNALSETGTYAPNGVFLLAPVYGAMQSGGSFDWMYDTTTTGITYAPSWTPAEPGLSICLASFIL